MLSKLLTKIFMSDPVEINSDNLSTPTTVAESMSANIPESCSMGETKTPTSKPITLEPPSVVMTSSPTTSPPVAKKSSMLIKIASSSCPLVIAPVI